MSDLPLRAVGHRIVILVDEINGGEDKLHKEKGIIVTNSTSDFESEKEFQETGVVVEIGPSAYNMSHHGDQWCKVGDRILYKKYDGKKWLDKETNKLYRIVNDEDVIAVILN